MTGRVKIERRDITNGTLWLLSTLAVLGVCVIFVVPLTLGARPAVVLTQSMQPALEPGDMVMIDKRVNASDVRVGDVIETQQRSGDKTTVTHRVMSVTVASGKTVIVTKGDNNATEDAPLIQDGQVRGRVINFPGTNHMYVVPKLGWLKRYPLITVGAFVVFALAMLFAPAGGSKRGGDEEDATHEASVSSVADGDLDFGSVQAGPEDLSPEEQESLRKFRSSRDTDRS